MSDDEGADLRALVARIESLDEHGRPRPQECVGCGRTAPDEDGGVHWCGRRWCSTCAAGRMWTPAQLDRLADMLAEPGEWGDHDGQTDS